MAPQPCAEWVKCLEGAEDAAYSLEGFTESLSTTAS